MDTDLLPLDRQLRQEILFARERVYRFGVSTPLERFVIGDGRPGPEIWVKREDLSVVKSYKWRGACNRIASLSNEERTRGIVTASAGNHAQGVALASRKLGIAARIYMPRSTPRVKQEAVRHLGGDFVEICLVGDSYDEAVLAARADEKERGCAYIHAYDDLKVMAGQGTLADEVILSGQGPFDVAFLQIGGGGMAAAVASWLKVHWPEMEVVGVEADGQASMRAALEAGRPVSLREVDIFCDGTAVRKAGDLAFEICREVLARVELVSNAQVSEAIRILWEEHRCVAEPSGALGLAAVLKNRAMLVGKKVLLVISGANVDFLQLGLIAQSEAADREHTWTMRIEIPEKGGEMLSLLDACFQGLNIVDFQYGKFDEKLAAPIFSLSAENAEDLKKLPERLGAAGYIYEDVTGAIDVAHRAIPLRSDLLCCPAFVQLHFYERPAALRDFLNQQVSGKADICYFNYRQSGERIGRALIGFDFADEVERSVFLKNLPESGSGYRLCRVVDDATHRRLWKYLL
ncbi:MAG: pyridoxal-phosphate dependent enzyme [Chthoniobacterales bacterium]